MHVLRATGVVLQFFVAPTVAASFNSPFGWIGRGAVGRVELIAPGESPAGAKAGSMGCRLPSMSTACHKNVNRACVAVSRIDFHPVRDLPHRGFYPADVGHPLRGRLQRVIVEPCADIRDAPLSNLPCDSCRLTIEPSVALAVALEYFDVLIFGAEQLCPKLALSRSPVPFDGDGTFQRVELFHS